MPLQPGGTIALMQPGTLVMPGEPVAWWAEREGIVLEGCEAVSIDRPRQVYRLLLDQDAALAAIPGMVSDDPAIRDHALDVVRRIVTATGELEGEKAKRFAEIEQLFAARSAPTRKSPARMH